MKINVCFIIISLSLCCLFSSFPPIISAADPSSIWRKDTLSFSGYRWSTKNGYYAPGSNHWNSRNVWVDENGYLHLQLTQNKSKWQCAEVVASELFGYGLYRFQVVGPVDQLDENAVLGLFLYPGPTLPFKVNNEIDIEFARWGSAGSPQGNFTVSPITKKYSFQLEGQYTTHQFLWLPDRIEFASFHGHDEPVDNAMLSSWVFRPEGRAKIPLPPLELHINYWLFKGQPPVQPVHPEIIIRKFEYFPAHNGVLTMLTGNSLN